MTAAPVVFQAHAVAAWLLFAIWPYTRLVHIWSVPLTYVGRTPVLYRSRSARAWLPASESPGADTARTRGDPA
jgi:nitrate reductase gamma subunit